MRRYYPGYCARFRHPDQNMLDKFGNFEAIIAAIVKDTTQVDDLDQLCTKLGNRIKNPK